MLGFGGNSRVWEIKESLFAQELRWVLAVRSGGERSECRV